MIETLRKHKTKLITAAIIVAVLVSALAIDGLRNAQEINYVPDISIDEIMGVDLDDLGEVVLGQMLDVDESEEIEDIPDIDEPETATETPAPPQEVVVYHPDTEHDVRFEVSAAHLAHSAARTPVEPEDMVRGDSSFYVTLSVRVDTLLHNMHLLHHDKHELVPENGVIFFSSNVRAYEGESVFNVLQREMRRHGIHMSSRFTPMFNSAYVEAINNLFEFDGGPLSGWMYRVNGWFPNFGASRYLLQPGDVIEWMYTVDLGRDVGGYFLSDGGR